MPSRYFALIPAAGIGARIGREQPKQYLPLAGKVMLRHVLDTFAGTSAISHTYIVVSATDPYIDTMISGAPYLAGRVTVLREGGASRKETVMNGLLAIRQQVDDKDWILVHDAARPGLTTALIGKLIDSLRDDSVGGLLALPLADTLKRSGTDGRIESTVPRERMWAAQTPQMFRYALLQQALNSVEQVTDEASAVEALGLRPRLVEGSFQNFKVTHPQDVQLAELILKELHE